MDVLNGTNSQMLSIMTGKSIRDEARAETTTFSMMDAVRATRLRWAGHILRMKQKPGHPPRLVQQALHHIFDNRAEGDLLMDAPHAETWEELQEMAEDRIEWRDKVNRIKFTVVTRNKNEQRKGKKARKRKGKKKGKGKHRAKDKTGKSRDTGGGKGKNKKDDDDDNDDWVCS